ncbi:hypothetical protein FQN57_006790 [Myotisia sp. PD_48]|nr:hypothetical protein FQN57_006790 [Myotisia sp. PD_48]
MSTADNITPMRKLKTYGKQPRQTSHNTTPHGRSDETSKPFRQPASKAIQKEGRSPQNGSANHRIGNNVGSPSVQAKPSTATPHTPLKPNRDTIFDFPSSEDELRVRTEPSLKRRKLNTPLTVGQVERFDRRLPERTTPSGNSKLPSTRTTHHDRSKIPPLGKGTKTPKIQGPTANTATSDRVLKTQRSEAKPDNTTRPSKHEISPISREAKAPRVEVVIVSPSKSKAGSESPALQRLSDKTVTLASNKVNGSRIAEPSPSKSRTLPMRQPVFCAPFKEPNRITKPLASVTDRGREGAVHDSPEPISTSTPGRRRLVDALGSAEPRTLGSMDDSSSEQTSGSERASRSPSPILGSPTKRSAAMDDVQPTARPRRTPLHNNKPPSLHKASSSGLKVTYSRQRSFLNELDLIEGTGGSGLNDIGFTSASQKSALGAPSQSSLGLSNQLDAELDDDGISGTGNVRSIHELRRSGDNARYQATVETIFEDIEDPEASVSRKRSGMVQLCSKLLDSQFSQRFLSNALEKRFAKIRQDSSDIICCHLTACVYALLLTSGSLSPITLQMCWTEILQLATVLLQDNADMAVMARRRESNMSKAGRADMLDLAVKLKQSKIWPGEPPSKMSPRLVGLRCLELAVRKLRETGNTMEAMPNQVLEHVVEILVVEDSLVEDMNTTSAESLLTFELTFSILESYTINTLALGEAQQETLKRLSRLGGLFSKLQHQSDGRSRQIQVLEIRLILNITNNNPTLCEEFSSGEFIGVMTEMVLASFQSVGQSIEDKEEPGAQKDSLLDTVILALGALINLTEWSDRARRAIMKPQAGSNQPLVDQLLPLFVNGLATIAEADSVVQTHSNVAFGYLSVLLCTVCLDSGARAYIRNALETRTFNRLLGTVEEFLHYHRKVEELQDVRWEEDAMAGFTSRLQGIVDRIRST